MKTILYLDFVSDSPVLSVLENTVLENKDVEVIHFAEIEQEGHVWPNIVKRCSFVLISGLTGLVDDNPQLANLLNTVVNLGMRVEVLCVDQPIAGIHDAIIAGIHYRFAVDCNDLDEVSRILEDCLDQASNHQFTA